MTRVIEMTPPSSAPAEAALPSLVGLDREKLGRALETAGVAERERRMRVNQLWHWIYLRGATSFDEMTNVSKHLRTRLAEVLSLARPEIVVEQVSQDGTRKWLLRMPADTPGEKPHEIECVYIPEKDRGTLCVSSQVGCTLNCSFCHTGTQRLVRNLTAAEIVAQVMVARDRLGDYPGRERAVGPGLPTEGDRLVTNIVFMGMGEPLYAYDSVAEAIEILSDGDGLGLGKRRITVSTSGIVPEIERLGREVGPMLAISLHAVRDELRDVLVPINKKYPIEELIEACRTYPPASNAKRITFEYVMLKGVNDSPADAKALVKLLEGVPAKINLIPFNPWPGTQYECSDWETIERFSDIVFRAGYASPVRTPRGRDILAACGQLKSETEKLSARERLALRAMAAAAE
ncbi:23S rRNA (adenine(2503)-C(2))-methyltransferase RlmN [Aquabacter sp. CN5-332]|uniref:23S rRNA (adenine(2503)-C(2))-methyltransferase RlmN n=1 Tax=Aquabacter sp. CN5-332 TaxID=3156608 RepID=UPI0032B4B1CB